jgi:hypothetical protein
MVFIETFMAVFIATVMGQVSVWWFKKEIEHRLDKHYDKLKDRFKGKVVVMNEVKMDIRKAVNGKYLVKCYGESTGFFGKGEVSEYAFDNLREILVWLDKKFDRVV